MAGACDALTLADQEHETAMEQASSDMLARIQHSLGQHIKAPVRDDFIWRMPGGATKDATAKWTKRCEDQYARAKERLDAREALAAANRVSRDPCPMCGVRADYGCKHGRLAA